MDTPNSAVTLIGVKMALTLLRFLYIDILYIENIEVIEI